ncbi:MAG: C4-dicarboxylate transporter substrate-binding protein [Deltaproteobacteria bacterium]|nr:C4-dicarboxylate transporter substrate-binding protein [Deltaproteobacteria bacterium]
MNRAGRYCCLTLACCTVFICTSVLFRTPVHCAPLLKTITFSATNTVWVRQFHLFTDAASRDSKYGTRFLFIGGPEAIPPFEQIEAVRRGVVDLALLPGAYFVPQLPEADAMKLSRHTPMEERKNGIFAFYRELMEKQLNVVYLGKIAGGVSYNIYLKRPINKPDFGGLKIRVTPIYEPFVKALGGVSVTTAPGEVYVALERAIVDGFGWPSIGIHEMGWQEVVRYIIEPGFYQTDVCVLMNKKKWESLPAAEQKHISGAMERAERESYELSRKMAQQERQLLADKGIKVIEFRDAQRQFYLDTAYRSGWKKIVAKNPRTGAYLKKLMEQ